MTVYVQAPSKKSINESLATGSPVPATEFNAFNPNGYITHHTLNNLPTGTVVKVYQKLVQGNPYAKAYGTFDKENQKLK